MHAVGLLVTRAPSQTTFELLGRRVDRVLGELASVWPEIEWSRPSAGRALAFASAADARHAWRALLEAGRMHGLASIGEEAATRYRLLEARAG